MFIGIIERSDYTWKGSPGSSIVGAYADKDIAYRETLRAEWMSNIDIIEGNEREQHADYVKMITELGNATFDEAFLERWEAARATFHVDAEKEERYAIRK